LERWVKNYCVEVYQVVNGAPSPLDPEIIEADTDQSAAEKLCGAQLVKDGPCSKLAAFVWPEGAQQKMVPFYRTEQVSSQ